MTCRGEGRREGTAWRRRILLRRDSHNRIPVASIDDSCRRRRRLFDAARRLRPSEDASLFS